jgi:pilus assembly protein CpaF
MVNTHKLENNARKIMDISECVITPSGEREYRSLYSYHITKNDMVDGEYRVDGVFGKPNIMSDNLRRRLIQYGVPQGELNFFLQEGSV